MLDVDFLASRWFYERAVAWEYGNLLHFKPYLPNVPKELKCLRQNFKHYTVFIIGDIMACG